MSDEEEIKLLLKFRGELEGKIDRLQNEIQDFRTAVSAIDSLIIKRGFQRAAPAMGVEIVEEEEAASIKSKDGTVLGAIHVDEKEMSFEPSDKIAFSVSIQPFQSFLVDRVLANMRVSDEARVSRGEMEPEEILSYEVQTEGETLKRLVVHNYGGERRLREIRSSLRWTLDKMYEKRIQS